MDFDEALTRFSKTDPKEVEELKQKKGPPKRPQVVDDVPKRATDADAN